MDIVIGSVVKSKAGRDKDRFFVVLALESDFATLADGDLRKIDKPKRKKLRHLCATGTMFTQHVMSSDKTLYSEIKSHFYSNTPSREG